MKHFYFFLFVMIFCSCSQVKNQNQESKKVEYEDRATKITYSDSSISITTNESLNEGTFITLFIDSASFTIKRHKADWHQTAVNWAVEYKKQRNPNVNVRSFTFGSLDSNGKCDCISLIHKVSNNLSCPTTLEFKHEKRFN